VRRGLLALSWIFLAQCALAQTPDIRTGTQIVVVDVTVTDSHGTPVRNLKQSDFSLLESDAPQTISHFDEHNPPTPAELANTPEMPKLAPNTYTNLTLSPDGAPINILLVDSLNTPLTDQANARQQLNDFVHNIKPGTRLAVFGLTTRLTLLQGVTSDPQLLLAAVNNKSLLQTSPVMNDALGSAESLSETVRIPSPQIKETMRTGEAGQAAQLDRVRVTATLNAMNQLARYLSGMPGRKNLIWLSGSFPMNFLPTLRVRNSFVTTDSVQAEVRETTNLFLRSQVAVYPVDAKRLQTTPLSDVSAGKYVYGSGRVMDDVDTFVSQNFDDHNTMRLPAQSTGGAAFVDSNNLRGAIDKAIDNGASYYTLVYTPSNKAADGKYRKITVHLNQSNYTITHRDGYYADSSATVTASTRSDKQLAAPSDSMHQAMLRGAPSPTQIIFKALFVADPKQTNKPAEGNVVSPKSKQPYRLITVAYAANPSDISMPAREDGLRHVDLDFVTLVYDRDGQLFNQQTNRVDVFAKPEAVQDFAREGVRYQQQIAIPAKGEYYLRSGIHDLIGDKIGTIEVPASSITVEPPK